MTVQYHTVPDASPEFVLDTLCTGGTIDVDLNNPQNSTSEIWQAPYNDSMVGEIKISEETETTIKGTFSFTGKNVNGDQSVKTIKEGSFNLTKQTS